MVGKTKGRGRDAYLELFSGEGSADSKQLKALEIAHNVRQFEIELYWKRAAYFWTILAVALAGFFTAMNSKSFIASVFIGCIGFVINLAWYMVNRGGSRWQQNWEFHVDYLEDEITGPIYKTQFSNHIHKLSDIAGAYAFSPTRTNAAISIFTLTIWIPLILLASKGAVLDPSTDQFECVVGAIAVAFAVVFCIFMLRMGRARSRPLDGPLQFSTRSYDTQALGGVTPPSPAAPPLAPPRKS